MGTQALDSTTTARALHADMTECKHPELCEKTRTVYWVGGSPTHPDTLGE